jgi:hypothetical protein
VVPHDRMLLLLLLLLLIRISHEARPGPANESKFDKKTIIQPPTCNTYSQQVEDFPVCIGSAPFFSVTDHRSYKGV